MRERRPTGRFDFGVREETGTPAARPRATRAFARLAVLLVVIAILAVAGGWLWKHPEHLPASIRSALRGSPMAPPPGESRLYRWRNERGEIQITDRPPPEGTQYEALDYRHDVNVLPIAPPKRE